MGDCGGSSGDWRGIDLSLATLGLPVLNVQ